MMHAVFFLIFCLPIVAFPVEVYLVRHGLTDRNLRDESQAKFTDTPLNEEGREQACQAGKELGSFDIDKIYSSDFLRAYETAQIVAKEARKDVCITKTAKLREQEVGNWAEMAPTSRGVLREKHHLDCGRTKEAWMSYAGDGSVESYEEMFQRFTRFLSDDIIPNLTSENKPIIFVSHGMFICGILYHICDYIPTRRFQVDNGGWIKLQLHSDGTLELLNTSEDKVRSVFLSMDLKN